MGVKVLAEILNMVKETYHGTNNEGNECSIILNNLGLLKIFSRGKSGVRCPWWNAVHGNLAFQLLQCLTKYKSSEKCSEKFLEKKVLKNVKKMQKKVP